MMKLSAPWMNYYREIEALFAEDNEVKVLYNDEEKELKLLVDNNRKADALAQLFPEKKTFGNVEIKIVIIPANSGDLAPISLFKDAFYGNKAVVDIVSIPSALGSFDYVVFKKKVVQYYNDNLGDINGNRSTLYQDIAKEVFETSGVNFCTEAVEK